MTPLIDKYVQDCVVNGIKFYLENQVDSESTISYKTIIE